MNKTAKEMFEELGYEQKIGVDFILYVLDSEETKDLQYYIEFHTDVKTIIINTNRKDFINDIAIKELQAINKQVEELKWNEDEFIEINNYTANVGKVDDSNIENYIHIIFEQQSTLIHNQKILIEKIKENNK